MTKAAFPRRLAEGLLHAALRITPGHALDWGEAMLGELRYVEGNWSALLWSVGSAGVLATQALVALIFRGGNRPVPTSSGFFPKEARMRKATLYATAVCLAASLLFFAAPVFRQAFQVSLTQWHEIFHIGYPYWDEPSNSELEFLEKKAEQNHDPEALAFVAARNPDSSVAARYADEAVRLNPRLTWVYVTSGAAYPSQPESARRVTALKKWDPENALPYLIDAQAIGVTVSRGSKEHPFGRVEESAAWEKAMEAAFQSPKLNDYGDRQEELDRRVLARYDIKDPFLAPSDDLHSFPTYSSWYSSIYAKSLLESGQMLESKNKRKDAKEKYSAIARFCQIAGTLNGFLMRDQCKEASQRLAALSTAQGEDAEAKFYASLGDELSKNAEKEWALRLKRLKGSYVPHWNAFLVRLSGLLLLVFSAVLLLCVSGVVIRYRSLRIWSFRPSHTTHAFVLGSAIGALLSSAVLFVSYWPYSEILERFLTKGDDAGLAELSRFLGDVMLPIGSQNLGGSWYVGSQYAVFYFWLVVAMLCVAAGLIALVRHLQTRSGATAS